MNTGIFLILSQGLSIPALFKYMCIFAHSSDHGTLKYTQVFIKQMSLYMHVYLSEYIPITRLLRWSHESSADMGRDEKSKSAGNWCPNSHVRVYLGWRRHMHPLWESSFLLWRDSTIPFPCFIACISGYSEVESCREEWGRKSKVRFAWIGLVWQVTNGNQNSAACRKITPGIQLSGILQFSSRYGVPLSYLCSLTTNVAVC